MEKPQLYALLVGINDYPSINKLSGCVADAEAVADFLQQQYQDSPEKLHIKKLLDADATRDNVIKTFREHFAQAKAGDTVYFHFSGHGSREDAPAEFHTFFPEGKNETLVCYDSRGFGNRDGSEYYDLADKELAVLIHEVAQNNPHIIISLDACHSGGGTRESENLFARKRQASNTFVKRGLDSYIGGYYAKQYAETQNISIPAASHVVFSACSATEVAWETTGNRGLFTQTLLGVLAETGIQASYGEVFERVQIRIRQNGGDQTPQVETFGQASVWSTFLVGKSAPNTQANPAVFFDKTAELWHIKAGALQGFLPIEDDALPTVSLYGQDMKTKIAEGNIFNITLETMKIHPDTLSEETGQTLDTSLTYYADLSQLNRLKVKLYQNNVTEVSPDNMLLPLVFEWIDDAQNTDYLLDYSKTNEGVKTDELKIVHQKTEKIIQKGRDISYIRDILTKIGKWESMRVLQNLQTNFKPEDISIRLEVGEYNTKTQKIDYVSIDVSKENRVFLDYIRDKATLKYNRIPYKVYVKNNSDKPVWIAALQVSPLYGISALCNTLIPAESEETVLLDGTQNAPWSMRKEQEKDTEADILTKFIVSTQRIEANLLTQIDFSINEDNRNKGNNRSSTGGTQPDSSSIDPREINDWFTIDVHVHLAKEQKILLPAKKVKVDNWELIAPDDFSAKISFESIDTNTRGVGDTSTAIWKRLASVLRAGKDSRSTTGGQEIITLSNVQGTVSEDKPLKIQLNEILQPNEQIVTFALDGDLLVPIGISATDNPQIVEIYNLPETDQQANSRSIGRAIRFCLSKITSSVFGTSSNAFFQLRSVDYPAEGEPTYQTYDKDLASIQAQVKSANKILLLIHGIIGNTTDIVAFARTLKQAGKYDLVLTFDYENLNTEINDISYQLKRRLVGESAPYTDKEQFEGIGISKDKKIDIIAHSMGGLVSRHMIEQRGGSEFVNRLIMCGTPNGGSNFGKIEQFRKIASIGALIGANLFAPFSAVAWLVSALKGVKMATGSSSLLFKTLGQMDRNSTFLHGLNQDGKAGGIPYFILAGNVQNYEPENTGLWQKILDKTLEGVGNAVNLGEPNDIAVLTNDIKQTGKNTDVTIYDIPCHHLNYFVEENSVQKLLEILQ